MKIVVIGGTGLIGSQLVKQLQSKGQNVLAASPNTGVNTITGEGLAEALKDATVVVDVSNSPSFEDKPVMEFFKTSNENLLAAEKLAGVKHHIALSVVGTQKMQGSGYFRAKQVQEDLIKASGIPYSIIHATQFFEFASGIIHMNNVDGKIVLPEADIQPIASIDVATFLAEKVLGEPLNRIVEIGGPEKFYMADWVKQYAKATGKDLEIVADKTGLYSGMHIEMDSLIPQAAVNTNAHKYAAWIADPANQR